MVMYSKFHTLYVREQAESERDEFGRIIRGRSDTWVKACKCRCDDNNKREIKDAYGEVYRPQYHIVCEGRPNVKEGDYVKCMDGTSVRGEGKVVNTHFNNSPDLNYSEIWV